MKSNLAGVFLGKSFYNELNTLIDLSRIILKDNGNALSPRSYCKNLLDNQVDIGFYENATLIFINDIRHIYPLQLSRLGQVFKFALSDTSMNYVFEYYLDGTCKWDEYISQDENGEMKSRGSNVVKFQNKDITTQLFPSMIRQLFKFDLDLAFSTNFTRYSFEYDFSK